MSGGTGPRPGTAQAALRHRDFRIIYLCTFASNIGTWMQNVVLGAFAYKVTGSGTFVSLLYFCQLGPLLFLSMWGGVLADAVDRRRLLVTAQVAQALFSIGLAYAAFAPDPPLAVITVLVLAVGIANALGAPGMSAVLPTLVPREDLTGAVALTSIQMNLSRVIGPAIGGVLYATLGAQGAAWVFAINAATYGFAVIGLLWATYPRRTTTEIAEQGLRKVLSGVRIARRDPYILQLLLTLTSFSFFSVTFVGIMPQIAQNSFGIDPKSWQYGVLYAVFGIGAALGATSVGTLLAEREKISMLRPGFIAFAALLTVFALLSAPVAAYIVVTVLGGAYFHIITCLSTALQQHLADDQRGRVMALWIMGFGGTVPLGVLVAGPFTDRYVREVMFVGVVWAIFLAWWSDRARLARKARLREDVTHGN
ncbi:MAG: MFS transporter [Actinomycetota bacterium]